MKYFIVFVAASLLCVGSTHAEIVIDDFMGPGFTVNNVFPVPATPPPQALDDDATGTRAGSVTPGPVALAVTTQLTTTGAGDLSIVAGGATSVLNLNYALSTPLEFANGLFNLDFDIFETVSGLWTATVSINGGAQTSGPVAVSAGQTLRFAPVGPVTVNDIEISLAQTGGAGGFILNSSNNASIVANPEPASIGLLGLTGLAGLVVLRRRNKVKNIA